jgi:hypothetical protein
VFYRSSKEIFHDSLRISRRSYVYTHVYKLAQCAVVLLLVIKVPSRLCYLTVYNNVLLTLCFQYVANSGRIIEFAKMCERPMMKINEMKELRSGLPKIKNYENTFVHELVWAETEKWPNRLALVRRDTMSYTYTNIIR